MVTSGVAGAASSGKWRYPGELMQQPRRGGEQRASGRERALHRAGRPYATWPPRKRDGHERESVGQEELEAAGALLAVDPEPEPEPEPEPDDDPEEEDDDEPDEVEPDDVEPDDEDDSDLAGLFAALLPLSDPDVRESVR
ncbi:hypothetical protein [Micromonospora chalcea]|uniref:hypothetical protein n=1 Tax=Micromonospora chalcea TaxID=1874 RepID=UPI003804B56C